MYNGQRYNLLECNGCPSLSIDLRPLGNNDLAFTARGTSFSPAWHPRNGKNCSAAIRRYSL